ncbi:MAG: glycosyltransferase [Sphingobacteriales bacterium]|nr:MAG: glycosyltransferase [Sphingobacteriales bacterium]
MKIIILGSAYPLRGDLATYNERLAKAFQDEGHDVTIYNFSLQYPSILFPGKSQYSTEGAPNDLKIITKVNSINPLNWIAVGNEIKNLKPDLLIVKYWLPFMGPCFGTILRRAKKNKHTKVVSILDNIIPHEKRIGDSVFTKYFIKPVDGFISMSANVKEDLKQFDTTKPSVLQPHPLYDNFGESVSRDEALKELNLSSDFRYLLFFGFIRKYKGLDILLDAMDNEKIKELPIKLLVAGEFYENEKPYLEQIEKLKLKKRVLLFKDFISNERVKYFFSATDLVVQPYRHATQSGVTQVAYQFNVPMIVTDVGGLAEIVPDGKAGYVVPPTSNDIANAIVKTFQSDNLSNLISGVIEEKKRFSWRAMVASITSLLKN